MKKYLFLIVATATIFFNNYNLVCAYYFSSSLSEGMTGQAVTELQTILKAKGFYNYPEITGYYGRVTVGAVQAFQTANGLSPVGSVGPQTRALLNNTSVVQPPSSSNLISSQGLGVGARGQDVIDLQSFLKAQGFYTYPEITGYYGPGTAQAVTLFQEKYAVEILYPANLSRGTGYAGASTIAKVNSLAAAPPANCSKPDINISVSAQGVVDGSFSYSISALPGTSLSVSGLPPGLVFSQQTISGIPTTVGQYNVLITATNTCGTTTKYLIVYISPSTSRVPSISFSASPTSVQSGARSVLTWSAQNVNSCSASNDWTGAKSLSGSETTAAIVNLKTYTLTCTGQYGTVGQSVMVSVNTPNQNVIDPPTVTLNAHPASVVSGNATTLSWSINNATYCLATGGWSGTKIGTGSYTTSALSGTTAFTLSCGNNGGTTTKSVSVAVTAPVASDDQKVLVVYNSTNSDSEAIKNYYLERRPAFSQVATLGVSISNAEISDAQAFTDSMLTPISNWINQNPSRNIKYIVLMPGLPTRISGSDKKSVQVRLNVATGAYITTLEMGSADATRAYINKLSSGSGVVLSGAALGKAGTTYYFDDAHGFTGLYPAKAVRDAVLAANSTATVFYTDTDHVTNVSDVAGYLTWGGNGGQGADYPTDGSVVFTGKSNWYPIETIESYNGMFSSYHLSNFIKWFSSNAFGGSNYSNTPIGAVTHTEEPGYGGINTPTYFVLWDQGKSFAEAAWSSRITPYFMAVGDPLVTK